MSAALLIVLGVLAGGPDQIAFMRSGSVWIADVAAGSERRVVEGLQYDRPLAWSPDGAHLLYWKHSNVGWDIWRAAADGSGATNLTNTTSGGCRSAAYSPDGTRIAFMRDNPQGVYVMDADGANQRRLAERGHRDETPAWSPDGRSLAYVELSPAGERRIRLDIYGVDSGGGNDRRLTADVGSSESPAWSPDGRSIVFAGSRAGNREILLMAADGTGERALTKTPENESHPIWSPDGGMIAFLVELSGERAELRVMNADGSGVRTVAPVNGRAGFPGWSPDGTTLVFMSREGGRDRIVVTGADGSGTRVIGEGLYPVWRPVSARAGP